MGGPVGIFGDALPPDGDLFGRAARRLEEIGAGAVLVTLWGFSFVQPYAQNLIGQPMLANIAAGLALFLISLVIFSLISHAIANLVRNSRLAMA